MDEIIKSRPFWGILRHSEAFWAIFGYISAPIWLIICYRNCAYIHNFTIFSWQCYNTTNYYTNWQISITQLSIATVLWLRFWLSLESTRLNMTQTKFVWLDLSQIMTQNIFVWFDSSQIFDWMEKYLTWVKSSDIMSQKCSRFDCSQVKIMSENLSEQFEWTAVHISGNTRTQKYLLPGILVAHRIEGTRYQVHRTGTRVPRTRTIIYQLKAKYSTLCSHHK